MDNGHRNRDKFVRLQNISSGNIVVDRLHNNASNYKAGTCTNGKCMGSVMFPPRKGERRSKEETRAHALDFINQYYEYSDSETGSEKDEGSDGNLSDGDSVRRAENVVAGDAKSNDNECESDVLTSQYQQSRSSSTSKHVVNAGVDIQSPGKSSDNDDVDDVASSIGSLRSVHLMSEDEQVATAMRLSLGEDIPITRSYSTVVQVKKEPGAKCGKRSPTTVKPNQKKTRKLSTSSSNDEGSDGSIKVVRESFWCQHCDASFSSKMVLQKHMEAVMLAKRYRPKSVGTDVTGASVIKDSWITPIYNSPKKRERESSPARAKVSRKKRKVQKQTKRDSPSDWDCLNSVQMYSNTDSDSTCSETDASDSKPVYFKKWKVMMNSKATFFKDSNEVAMSLLNAKDAVNTTVPLGCDQNYAFLVDTRSLRHGGDLTCDETGKYKKPSYTKTNVLVGNEEYTLVRKYMRHKDSPGFTRGFFELHKDGKRAHHMVIVRYEWKGRKGKLVITPHGRSKDQKNAEPFIRSKKSLIAELKTTQKKGSAQAVVNSLFDKEGGSENIQSFSSVPRDSWQIYRHSSSEHRVSNFQRVLELNMKGDFVKGVEFLHDGGGPKPRVFLCTDMQANDVKMFCCTDKTILSIDPTYDLGDFLLTASSFRHPMYVNKENGKQVLMPGPMMIHVKRDAETYGYFSQRLSTFIEDKTIHFYGTDGEKALVKGLESGKSFANSTHLMCMLHHKQNCAKKLQTLGVRKNKRRILRSIYGEQVLDVHHQGLVDSQSAEDFDSNLSNLQKTIWDQLETEETDKPPQFSEWFLKYKASEVRETMLKALRLEAGMGDATKYTTNDCESLNAMIKRWTDKKKMTWENICTSLQDFVDSKYKELELALHGSGDRRLAKQYAHLQLNKVEWAAMSKEERQQHAKKAKVSPPSVEDDVEVLSIGPEESGIGGFTIHELNEVWYQAGVLLGTKGSIIPIPLKKDSYMCFGGKVPIGVTERKKNEFACEILKCNSFVFHDKLFCHHTIAVAEKCGRLADFIASINAKKRSSTVNLVNNLLHQQCTGAGKKGNASKRKGPNNVLSKKVQRTVPPLQVSDTQSSSSSQPVASPQPFSVCFKAGVIRVCYGCGNRFADRLNTPPNDLILRRFDHREWYDKDRGEKRRSNQLNHIYYHLGMDCVRRRYPYTQIKDIIVYDEVKKSLTEDHVKKLRQFGIEV